MKKVIAYTEIFRQFENLILNAFNTFNVWKTLQNEEYNDVFKIYNLFWSAVLPSLQDNWLLSLARLYEKSIYSEKGIIISVPALILRHPDKDRAEKAQKLLEENNEVLSNISKLRAHQLAHNNADHLADPSKLLKKFPIKYSDIEKIFELTAEIISILNPNKGHSYALDLMTKDAKSVTENIIKDIKYFQIKKKNI